jgi:four helix bundle protein
MQEEFKIIEELKQSRAFIYGNELSNIVWKIVSGWNYFEKNTIGTQWCRSTDSISANIAEGFGRYFYKEKNRFYCYSRGSLVESMIWLEKAYSRKLVSEKNYDAMSKLYKQIPYEINILINNLRKFIN